MIYKENIKKLDLIDRALFFQYQEQYQNNS